MIKRTTMNQMMTVMTLMMTMIQMMTVMTLRTTTTPMKNMIMTTRKKVVIR